MNKQQVVSILSEIGTLLELQGESAFRFNAYHNAARTIEQLDRELEDLVESGELGKLKGIGKALEEKITSLVKTDSLKYYDDLKAKTPEGLLAMMRIPGLGPKKIKVVYDELGVDTLDKLKSACESGEVAKLKGFGKKTAEKILEGLEFLDAMGDRKRIDTVLPLAENLIEEMKAAPGVKRIELCGSLRRRRETIKDIDILVSAKDAQPVMERFVSLPNVVRVIGQGDTKSSVVFEVGSGAHRSLINADLRVVEDQAFPFALHYFTGGKEHNIAMRARAQERKLKLNEYGLVGDDTSIKAKDEADIFKALDLDWIPPEMREDTGEMKLAEEKTIPDLITFEDLRGVFHNHSTWSDGSHSLREMAEAAKALGWEYFGIGDHSQSLTIARGLTPERVREQHAEIDEINKSMKGFRVFKGTECDILEDGSLDYDDELLATFDYVVASVHSHFNQSREVMTERILMAMRNPHVTMLGHATGRLILKRAGYQVDLEAVIQEAAKRDVMIEINAQPSRLDLDWNHCKRAKELGVQLVINPDAHHTEELAYARYGVDVARRGWLTKKDVFNCQSLKDVEKYFRHGK